MNEEISTIYEYDKDQEKKKISTDQADHKHYINHFQYPQQYILNDIHQTVCFWFEEPRFIEYLNEWNKEDLDEILADEGILSTSE